MQEPIVLREREKENVFTVLTRLNRWATSALPQENTVFHFEK